MDKKYKMLVTAEVIKERLDSMSDYFDITYARAHRSLHGVADPQRERKKNRQTMRGRNTNTVPTPL